MTSDGVFSYTYDALGRLAGVTNSSGTIAGYRYNALGQRVAKDTQGDNNGTVQVTLFLDTL